MSGMYEVTWPEFSSNRTSYLYEQVKQNNFVDVTIVFDDEEVSAHKVVLASSSSFFQRVLERSTHPNPMLYLKGVEKRLFSLLLEFIYLGEVSLPDADFDKFLQMARDLKIKGLLMENPGVEEIDQGSYALEDESVTLKDDSYIDNQETPKKQEQRKSIDTPFVALKERSDSKVIKEDKSYSKVMKEDKSYSRVLKEERSYQSIISEEKIDEETGDYDLSDPVSAEIYAKIKRAQGRKVVGGNLISKVKTTDPNDTVSGDFPFEDPTKVKYSFLMTGRARPPGILVTHGGLYKFHKNNINKNETVHWWACGEKRASNCQARAKTKIGDDGNHVLISISHPEEHSPFHVVDEAKRVAESLVAQLTKAAQTDLVSPVGSIKDDILKKDLQLKYKDEPGFVAEVLNAMPIRVTSTMTGARAMFLRRLHL